MNSAIVRLSAELINVSNARYFMCEQKVHLLKLSHNSTTILYRTKATKRNLFEVSQIPSYGQRENENSHYKTSTGVSGYLLLGIPLAAFVLGTWQIARRKTKLDLIEDLKSRTTAEPVEIPEDLEELKSMEYCPVKARGRFLHEKEFTIGPKSLILNGTAASENKQGLITAGGSNSGYYVITPFKLEDRDLTILVNRGWVPTKQKNPLTRQAGQIEGVVDITGAVRLNETRPQFIPNNSPSAGIWYYRDLHAMAEVTGAAPVFIDLISKDQKYRKGIPIGSQTRVTLRNEHLSYIFTWYSLSAITAYMWYRQFIQKLPLM